MKSPRKATCIVFISTLATISGITTASRGDETNEPTSVGSVGYGGETVFLRTPGDRVVLFPGLRMQLDGYGFFGPSVADYRKKNGSGLKPNLSGKRARFELGGRVLDRYFFFLGGDFGGSALDDLQRPTTTASLADAFVGIDLGQYLDVRVGQFDVPFMMESVTSDKYFDFMERSLTVRVAGTYSDKDTGVMAHGALDKGMLEYAVAVVGGDGKNRPSVDARVDMMGRVIARPLATSDGALSRMHVGASVRWGKRDPNFVFYDAPTMSTAGGYAFLTPVYGKNENETHIVPSGTQSAFAGELYVPFDRFDLRGEVVYVKDGRREAIVSLLSSTERIGTLKGLAYYVQASVWPFGRARVNGEPGKYPLPRLSTAAPATPSDGLQIALRFEQMMLKYDSGALGATSPGKLDEETHDIKVTSGQLAINYWATRHVRFTAQYSLYLFPGQTTTTLSRFGTTPPTPGPATNLAGAPGARPEAYNFDARALHEIGLRFAVAL